MVDGEPPTLVKAGDTFKTVSVAHSGRTGPRGAKVLDTYVVEKGKPLASAAP